MKFVQPKYPLAHDSIDDQDISALREWLLTGARLSKGDLTFELEQKWAKWIGRKYAVFCNSGSSANMLMAYVNKILMNRKFNVEEYRYSVAVPAVGWSTTIAPFIQFGARCYMYEADKNNFSVDCNYLEDMLKLHPSIKSLIFVEVLGVPADIENILYLKDKYSLVVMEDACAALGSSWMGLKLGRFGDMSSHSFYMGHQLSTIEGGMVLTDNEEIYHLLLMLRSHGWGKDLPQNIYNDYMLKYNIDTFHQPFTFFVPGFNVRSTDLQAFLGLRQVEKVEDIRAERDKNHKIYVQNLQDFLQFQKFDNSSIVSSISVGALAENVEQRNRIVKAMTENDIETRLFSAGNLGAHPFWKDVYGEFRAPVANKVHSTGFFIPNYPSLTLEDISFISGVVKSGRF